MKKILPLLIFMYALSGYAQDSAVIHTIDSLLKEAGALASQHEFDSSLALNATAEELAIQVFTSQSAHYGRCLSNRGRTLMFQNQFTESDSILNLALSLLGTHVGPEHVDIATCLNRLGVLYTKMRKFQQSEKFYQEAATMQEKLLGELDPKLLSTLTNLATVYGSLGKNQEAEKTFIRIQKIYIETEQTETVKYTYLLNNFGQLYMDAERFNEAEALFLESSIIRKRLLGENHGDYGQSLGNLGNLYQAMDYREKAEKLLRQSLAIQEAALGPKHSNIAYPCHNLATLYTTMGKYNQAEQLFLRAQSIWVNALGTDHPNNGYCLRSLAELYQTLGYDEQSEAMYIKAADLFEKAYGKKHFLYAMCRRGLGVYYASHQRYELAEPLLREVLDIMGEAIGKQDSRYIGGVINLAILHKKMGQWNNAQELLEEARATFEEDLKDTTHPYYLNCLAELASSAKHRGNYKEAISLCTIVMDRRKESLGEANMEYATGCFDLAHVQEISGKTEASIQGFEVYLNVAKAYLTDAVSFLSEEELFAYTSTFERDQAILYASLQHRHVQGRQTGNLAEIGYNLALFQKGFLQTAASRLNVLADHSPETRMVSDALKGYKRRLNEEMTKEIVERKPDLIAGLKDSITRSEKQLARLLAGRSEGLHPVDWKEVQAALAPGEVAIEFVQFERRLFNRSDSIQIAAMILTSGMDAPLYVPITEQQNLFRFLENKTERKADYVNEMYAWADRGLVTDEEDQTSLMELIWSPLAPHLEGATRLYIASAGLIHRINLGALPISDEEVLADRFQIVMLTSTRQVADRTGSTDPPQSAWLFGGIDFDPDTLGHAPVEEGLMATRSTPMPEIESGSRGESWVALKWTKKERQQIAGYLLEKGLNITEWSGQEAREEVCKSVGTGQQSSPSVLHLATHGFFFPDPTTQNEDMTGEPVFRRSDNPMIRSGLLLAGANYAWQNGRPWQEGTEDGILTADEISRLNLSNTELVVLSACETGLGDIQGNEGVYGLQRAFKIAGAKYLIMSLWQVPDRETMQFMISFYRNWLEGNMTIPDAFRKTQLEMRDRFFNPYSWAGFVLVE